MSHPFGCGTEVVCTPHPGIMFPNLGWEAWRQNRKSIYIRAVIDPSVTFPVECGEAIRRWNEQVGARFLMRSDVGNAQITFFERNSNEWPFNEWFLPGGGVAAGFALNFDSSGKMLGTNTGLVVRCDIYANRDVLSRPGIDHPTRVWVFGHEVGHAFGLADHPNDNALSIMAYRQAGQSLLGPTLEDVHGIAHIYDLHELIVGPQNLEGFENVESMWHFDRYGKQRSYHQLQQGLWSRWRGFFARFLGLGTPSPINDLQALEPDENYLVTLKASTIGIPTMLGFGRFSTQVFPGIPWTYR